MPEDQWVKSSFSYANSNCVEVRTTADGQIAVRNSRVPGIQLPPGSLGPGATDASARSCRLAHSW
jgi:hypothetical protein